VAALRFLARSKIADLNLASGSFASSGRAVLNRFVDKAASMRISTYSAGLTAKPGRPYGARRRPAVYALLKQRHGG
jgi:hypothetical protein